MENCVKYLQSITFSKLTLELMKKIISKQEADPHQLSPFTRGVKVVAKNIPAILTLVCMRNVNGFVAVTRQMLYSAIRA